MHLDSPLPLMRMAAAGELTGVGVAVATAAMALMPDLKFLKGTWVSR